MYKQNYNIHNHNNTSDKNILVDSNGRHLRIADFGTAFHLDGETYAYASEGDKLSVGRIICEMLSISPRSADDINTFRREFDVCLIMCIYSLFSLLDFFFFHSLMAYQRILLSLCISV